jgi:hypothetical protein
VNVGIVALGDSILDNDESWAYWLGRASGLPLTRLAVGGAKSPDVLDQLPLLDGHSYEIACIAVGTNDVLLAWDPIRFADNLAVVVAAASDCADRVVAQTIPLGLRQFPGGGQQVRRRVERANAIVEGSGALVVAGEDLRAPRLMATDRIHPSTQGQLLLADRAAKLLGIEPRPSSLHDGSRDFARGAYLRDTCQLTAKGILKRALRYPPPAS